MRLTLILILLAVLASCTPKPQHTPFELGGQEWNPRGYDECIERAKDPKDCL